jgi:hypothetical protein
LIEKKTSASSPDLSFVDIARVIPPFESPKKASSRTKTKNSTCKRTKNPRARNKRSSIHNNEIKSKMRMNTKTNRKTKQYRGRDYVKMKMMVRWNINMQRWMQIKEVEYNSPKNKKTK